MCRDGHGERHFAHIQRLRKKIENARCISKEGMLFYFILICMKSPMLGGKFWYKVETSQKLYSSPTL